MSDFVYHLVISRGPDDKNHMVYFGEDRDLAYTLYAEAKDKLAMQGLDPERASLMSFDEENKFGALMIVDAHIREEITKPKDQG